MSGIMEKHITALEANTEAVLRHNELLEKIISGASAASTADKPKGTRGKAADKTKTEDDDKGAAVDADDLAGTLEKVKGWLKKYSEAGEDDPENEARAEKLAAALTSLGVEKISAITTEADRVRAETWIDKMIAKGRLTPDPKGAGKKKGDDDEI
jgi:hypothetical protein